jgi:predicted transcriptional regulator
MTSLADDPEAVKAMDSAVLMRQQRNESKWFKSRAAKLLSKKHGYGTVGLKIPHWLGHMGFSPLEVRVLSLIVHWFEDEDGLGPLASVYMHCNVSKEEERFMATSYSAIAREVHCERRSVRRCLAILVHRRFIHWQQAVEKRHGANYLSIRPTQNFMNEIIRHKGGRCTWVYLWLQMALGKEPHAQSWLLSQLIYLTSRAGGVRREKRRWIVQSPRMLSKALGMSRSTVVDTLKKLKEKGLLEYRLWPYKGQKTLHICLHPKAIAELLEGSWEEFRKALRKLGCI